MPPLLWGVFTLCDDYENILYICIYKLNIGIVIYNVLVVVALVIGLIVIILTIKVVKKLIVIVVKIATKLLAIKFASSHTQIRSVL